MLELLKRWRVHLVLLAIPYLVWMLMMTYRIDFQLVTPGALEKVEDQVIFETMYDVEGHFYTIYVMAIDRPTFFQLAISYFDDSIDYSILPEFRRGISDDINWRSGQLDRDNAWNAAIITAYQALGYTVDYEIQLKITLIYDYISNPDIDLGDVVLSVNGSTDIFQAIAEVGCEETAVFQVKTKTNQVVDYDVVRQSINGQCRFGLSLGTYYHLIDVEIPYTVKPSFVGGPSGGVMQFLHMYNLLTEDDITQGRTIAGTGTIQLSGAVGSIGGVKQKVITAHHAGVDIMFVPRLDDDSYYDNYQVALRTIETLNTNMVLVGVSTWLEAVEYLLSLEDDPDV